MEHAFLITAYHNYDQLKEYVTFYAKQFPCFIHIDKRSKIGQEQINELNAIENVTALKKYPILWGSYKHIAAILDLMELALKDSSIQYVHIISGDDFLIKSPKEFNEFFQKNQDKNFIERIPCKGNPVLEKRFQYYYFMHRLDAKIVPPIVINTLVGLQKIVGIKRKLEYPYKGLIWASITREAAQYVLQKVKQTDYLKQIMYCSVPEEFFLQNIFLGSEFEKTIVNDNLRYNLWNDPERGAPAVLDERDLADLKKSEKMFARKIQWNTSKKLYEMILKDWENERD